MKTRLSLCILLVLILSQVVGAGICYNVTDLGGGRWQYDWTVTNSADLGVDPLEGFTIYFDYDNYNNLVVEGDLADWDELVFQRDSFFDTNNILNKLDGIYDAMALGSGLNVGQSQSGFSCSFDWLGTGTPGSQYYEIYDPDDFSVLADGYTQPCTTNVIPAPAALILALIGAPIAAKKRN